MTIQRTAREDGEADPRRERDPIAPLTPETCAERLRRLTEAAESLLLLRAAMPRPPVVPGNPVP